MKVSLVLRPGSNLVRGGTEVLADKTAEHLRDLGCEVDFVTPLTRKLGDVVHFYGCFESHWSVAEHAAQNRIPIVWSPIYGTPRSVSGERFRALRKRVTRTFPRLLLRLLRNTQRIIATSPKDQELIEAFFGIDGTRIRQVPHGVESRFATGDANLFRQHYGIKEDFVLNCAMVNRRKNQLNLILACEQVKIPLVCIGAPQENDYYAQCKQHAGSLTRMLDPIEYEDPLFPAAYAAATTFCLPSQNEVFGLVALEALVARCSLVISNTWGADKIYGNHALYVDPNNVGEIAEAVKKAFQAGRQPESASKEFLARYSWPAVTQQIKDVYQEAINELEAKA
jgi:glycosyltransferase involved in cell wall biosynthesis